ncbi:putative ribonuclease H-like domain-containing protein [Tanacetum coccineum]
MAYTSQGSSSSSSSDSEVHTCSKDFLKSYETLQKQYDQQREALNKSNLEIIGYQIGLESLEARLVVHEKNEAVYEEDIAFLKYDVQVKDISIKDLKNQLEEALKEKHDFKLKLEKIEESSKNLNNLINSQISAKGKAGLGKVFHAIPPPYTRNYMPSRPDLSFVGLDDFVYKTKVGETITTASKTSKDSLEKPKTVRPSAPIIEDWDTNSDNDSVFRPKTDQTKPKFTKINFVKFDKNVKSVNKENTHRQEDYPRKSQSPRDNRRNWNGIMTQKLGNGFELIKKACFVCGSFNHLIKDYDFHDKKMVEKPVLNNKGRITGQREIRPVWNNAQRVNHKNKFTHPQPKRNFIPITVVTKSIQVPVNTAKQSSPRAAASISASRPVNTAAPKSKGNPQYTLQDQGIFDSGWSRHMTGNKSFLTNYQEVDGGFVAFAGSPKGECLVLSPDFKLLDESQVLLKVPRQNKMYSFNLKNVVLSGGIKREFSVARTPQQNGVAERKNRALIEAARTMLADLLLPTTFWAEAINTACYVQNRVLVTKPHKKTPHELLIGIETNDNKGQARQEKAVDHEYILLPFVTSDSLSSQSLDDKDANEVPGKGDEGVNKVSRSDDQERTDSSTQDINTARPSINTANTNINTGSLNINIASPNDPNMPSLEETSIFDGAYDDEDVGAEADLNNLETTMYVSPIPTTRIHKDHPKDQIIGDLNLSTRTRRMINFSEENAMVIQALTDPSWIEAMQEELLLFKLHKVWTLVDLPKGNRAIGTKWVYRNKKDDKGIVVRNKASLVAQGYTQEEGIDYDEVFAPVTRIEIIRLFLAYASFMGHIVYQMDVKSAFLFEKALDGLHQAPRAWYETLSTYLLENRYRRGTIDKTLFIKKDRDDAQEILDEFYRGAHFLLMIASSNTPIETNKELNKDEEAEDVDVHLYRSMIGSLMYLTTSRPDIMFVVCAYARFQVTPKTLHLHEVKRIFRYLKGQPKLGLWYPRDSPFDLEAFFDSDYAGASLDRKSTTGGCQFLSKRLISCLCKKQTIVANSTTKVEYVAAANCCGQVLWIQNQMLDYGLYFMNTKIHIDNESTIYIVKNLVFHSKTKHIEIRHHFIRDSYEKKLIQMIKIHTDHNVADLLTKAFDVRRPSHLVADETVYKEWEDRMERAATTAFSLEAKQDSGSGPRVNTLGSGEDSMKLKELMGEGSTVPVESHHTPSGAPTTSQPPLSSPLRIPTRQEIKVPQPNSPTYTNVADKAAFTSVDVVHGVAATIVSSIDAGQGSGNIPKSLTMPHDSSLPRGHTPGNDEGSMTLHELTVLCTKLSNKVDSLETELKQTKQTYGVALTKLIKKVKKLGQTVKTSQDRRRAKIVVLDDERVQRILPNRGGLLETNKSRSLRVI